MEILANRKIISFNLKRIADFSFFGLCLSIYISLNSITDTFFGIQNIASPLILLFCVIILSTIGFHRDSFKNTGVQLFYLFFILYYFIGFAVRLYRIEINYDVSFVLQANNLITSLIIIFSFHQYLFKKFIIDKKEIFAFNSFFLPIAVSTLFALVQSFYGVINLKGGIDGRFSGFYQNPNALGLVANLALLLNIYSLFRHKRFFLIKIILLPLFLYVSFLSLSRTSLITAGMIILLSLLWMSFTFLKNGKVARKRFLAVLGVPIFLLLYITFNFKYLIYTYLDQWQAAKILGLVDLVFKGKINSDTTSSRSEHFHLFSNSFKENPIFGKGIAYFADIPDYTWGIHNTFLLVLGDAGIFPFLAMMFMVIYILFKALFLKPTIGLISGGLMVTWCLHCMASHNGLDDKMYLIILLFSVMYAFYGNQGRLNNSTKMKNLDE